MALDTTAWEEQITRLAERSRSVSGHGDYLVAVMGDLKQGTESLQALYLRHDERDGVEPFILAGDQSTPTRVSKLDELPDSDLREILRTALNRSPLPAYWERTVSRSATGPATEHVFCLTLPEHKTQHVLLLCRFDPEAPSKAPPVDEQAGLRYLTLLAHIQDSLDRLEATELRDARRRAIDRIMSCPGDLQSVAAVLCETWRKLLGAPAARLWLYNDTLDEMDLLHESFEEVHRPLFEHLSNRLPKNPPAHGPKNSLAHTALGRIGQTYNGQVIRSTDPRSHSAWYADPAMSEILELWPHLLCVPFILPEDPQEGEIDETPYDVRHLNLSAVLDIHLPDVGVVRQPNHRLLFLGQLSAAAIARAQSYERRKAVRSLTKLAFNLADPKPLKELKQTYLNSVIGLIRKWLHANCVSIFEADESREVIRCSASTGIKNHSDLDQVTYRKGEGATWTVFEGNQRLLASNVRAEAAFRGKYEEVRTISPASDHDPFLAVPLPGQDNKTATGVIRVLERKCHVRAGCMQNFSTHNHYLLHLIASLLSPVLQMLQSQAHRDRFVQRAAHQVTQPLQGALAYSDNLIEGIYGPLGDKAVEKLTYVRAMVRTAARMMKSSQWAAEVDLRSLDSIVKIPRECQSVVQYFLDRIIDVQPIRKQEGVQVQLVDQNAVTALGDFLVDNDFFDHAIMNVLHNAVKYSYPRTRVEVSVRRDSDQLIADVQSTGIPIPKEERKKIFWDRERGKWAELYNRNGTGQGLYIARKIMEKYGGQLLLLDTRSWPYQVTPPSGFPPAERNTFRLILPGAFR